MDIGHIGFYVETILRTLLDVFWLAKSIDRISYVKVPVFGGPKHFFRGSKYPMFEGSGF